MGWKEQGKKRYNKLTDVEGLSPALRPSALMKNSTADVHSVVSGQTSGTNTQPKSTGKDSPYQEGTQKRGKTISPDEIYPALQSEDQRKFNSNQATLVDTGTNPQNSTKGTSGQLTLLPYQNTTSSLRDFLANLSQLLGSEEVLRILEAHSSLRLCESLGLKEPRIYSLRTSGDSSPMMKGIHSKPFSERWMKWGMTANGRCLTANTTESRRTGSECLLSDILEDNPDRKYFLSEKQTKYIQNQVDKSSTPLTAIITKDG